MDRGNWLFKVVTDDSKAVNDFVAERLDITERGLPTPNCGIGVSDGGKLIFGAVYHDYDPEAGIIEMSCAADSPKWATKRIIHYLLAFAFEKNDCQTIFMKVSERNKRTRKLIDGLGFKSQEVVRLYGRHENGILFSLTDDDWRAGKYFNGVNDYGQKQFSSTRAA